MANEIMCKEAQFGHIKVDSVLDFYTLRTNKQFIKAIAEASLNNNLSISFSYTSGQIDFQVGLTGHHNIDIQNENSILSLNSIKEQIKKENRQFQNIEKSIKETKEMIKVIVFQLKKIFKEDPKVSDDIEFILLPINDHLFFIGSGEVHDILKIKSH